MARYREPLDRDWLEGKYSDEMLSMDEIAEEAGCSPTFVRVHILRYGIPIRDKSAAHRVHQEDDGFNPDMSVLTGCLLGDASLSVNDKASRACVPSFKKQNVNRDHIEYVSKLLFSGRTDRVKNEIS